MGKRSHTLTSAFILLCLFAAPVLFLAELFSGAVHEVLGHGVTALAMGGRFDGFLLYWTGGGYAEAYAAESAPIWQRVAVHAGGIVSDIVVGLVFLGVAARSSLGDDRDDDGGKRVASLEYHNRGGDLFLDAYLEES